MQGKTIGSPLIEQYRSHQKNKDALIDRFSGEASGIEPMIDAYGS